MSKKNRKKYRNKIETAVRNNAVAVNPAAQRTSEFNPDYSFVIKDLKRIGTLAVFFLTVLVLLSFILR
jgi:hypothetical protein